MTNEPHVEPDANRFPPEAFKGVLSTGAIRVIFAAVCILAFIVWVLPNLGLNNDAAPKNLVATSQAAELPAQPETNPLDKVATDNGWSIVQSGELYYKANEPGTFTCGRYTCLWYNVQSTSGCPGGAYVRADILSGGNPVAWTNAITPSILPGESVSVKLEDVQSAGDQFRVAEVTCTS